MKTGSFSSSSSSAVYGTKTPTYRRIVVSDDSLDRSNSESVEGDSFLSDDRSGTTSSLHKRLLSESETGTLDEVSKTDSFIVSDNDYFTDDSSFLLPQSDAEFSFRGTPSARRVQPLRCAKISSGETMMSRVCEADTSATDRKEENAKTRQLSGSVVGHGDNAIPELVSGRDILPLQQASSSHEEEHNERLSEDVGDSEASSTDADDRFETCKCLKTDLKKLREEQDAKTRRPLCGRIPLTSFIVSDSDVSSPSNSESGASDVSWYPDDTNDGGNKEQERHLPSSVKDLIGSSPVFSKKTLEADQDEHFLISLYPDYLGKRHPDAEVYFRKGVKNKTLRNDLTKRLFDIFRLQCFNEELPELLTIKWNPRLRKTAGLCRNKNDRTSWIELSPKVCSTPDRIRDTLVHEMCHAAVWIVDGVIKEGHGPIWKKWASRCMQRFRSLPIINRCHDYEIEAKFVYECGGCGQLVKRHTKSLDVNRKVCGVCKCSFTLRTSSRATSGTELEQNPFAKFVKENYAKYKKPGIKHGEIMRTLSQLYKAHISTKYNREGDAPEDGIDISVLSLHD